MNKPANGCENLEMYAVDGLDPEERAEFERHVQECAACAAELAELMELLDLLPIAADPVQIPEGMKDRILGNILNVEAVKTDVSPFEQTTFELPKDMAKSIPVQVPIRIPITSRSNEASSDYVSGSRRGAAKTSRLKPWIYGGLSAAVLILGVYSYNLRQDISDLKSRMALLDRPSEGAQVNKVVTLNGAVKDIVAKGLATIVVDAKGTHLLVQAEKLPELKNNEAYQVWLIKGKETPVNAGTFMTHDGTGGLYYTFNPNSYDTIAITLEPDAHGDKPRGTPVLAANLIKS
ncbi:anti-sigma factor [Paenibacillus sp. N3.4]|uniref:anti-sigma factor n=1 Tax=Paenibacillus sp. N3.4 TaxID=2603222 RepID=UPI0011CC8B13|nr:anti-sigma factor [Paenibacillus sp. N3.4]TXK75123.1 anti-sigma factor [Paenibacillus sp. N3.4]